MPAKKNWDTKPLGAVADLCLGKMLDQNKNKGKPLPYLANVNVRWGEFSLDSLRTMRFEPKEAERYGLKFGDIVMCEGGEPGRCAIWKNQVPGMMIQKALHRIRPSEVLDYRFLHYSFLHIGQSKGFDQFFTGSTIKHLPAEKLAKVEVPVPPLPVQRRIAGILSAYDELMENSQRRVRLLEAMARALYREWFVHFRFPGHERIRFVDDLPEGWERKSLEEVAEFRLGKMLDQAKNRGDLRPYLANVNVRWGEFDLQELREMRFEQDELETYGLKFGDIVMCEGGEPGRCAIWKDQIPGMMIQKAIHRIRCRANMNHIYLYHSLRDEGESGRLAALFTGATIKHLPREKLAKVTVVVPAAPLLKRFGDAVKSMEEQVETLQRRIQNLRRTRDLLLPRLLSGQVELKTN
jgi:type I restriction enzyme S subunit